MLSELVTRGLEADVTRLFAIDGSNSSIAVHAGVVHIVYTETSVP